MYARFYSALLLGILLTYQLQKCAAACCSADDRDLVELHTLLARIWPSPLQSWSLPRYRGLRREHAATFMPCRRTCRPWNRRYMKWVLFGLYSWWLPQIVLSAMSDTRQPLRPVYVAGTSAARLALPLYLYGCPANLLRIPPAPRMLTALVAFVAAQVQSPSAGCGGPRSAVLLMPVSGAQLQAAISLCPQL